MSSEQFDPNFQHHVQGGAVPGAQFPMYQQNPGVSIAQTSMILGILSLFVVGVVLGPIAMIKANEAERMYGVPSTVGKVTGLIGLILGALQVIVLIGYIAMILMVIPFAAFGS